MLWSRTLLTDTLAALAQATSEVLPGSGLAVERVGRTADDSSVTQFVAEPAYVHAWPNPDHSSVERAELLTQPAIKMLARAPGLSSDAMVAALTPAIGHLADLTFSHPRGLVEMSPPGVTKATGLAEVARRLGVWTRRTSSPSVTCPTTWRCCAGRGTAWRWVTHPAHSTSQTGDRLERGGSS
jgi:hydroxymethylpyrimidine pyrophosphatase-like HAD family hydrolase